MARSPRARRFTPETFGIIEPDAVADAVFTDTLGIAGDLGELLEKLKPFDTSTIHAMLFKKPASGIGGFAWLGKQPAPINMDELMEYLKSEYGGGEYRVSIFAGGKLRRQIEFPIYGPTKSGDASPLRASGEMKQADIFMLMMQMQEQSRRDAAEARREAMDQQRLDRERDKDRTNALVQGLGVALPTLLPLLFNREKLSDLIALMQAGKEDKSNLKDTVETVVLLKKAFGDDKGEPFDPENIVASVARLAGPVASGIGRALNGARGAPPASAEEPPAGYDPAELHLPPPEIPQGAPAPAGDGGQPENPTLRLIRPHLLYLYSAQLPPDLAADALVAIMDRAGVSDEDLNELVAAFTLSADWKADLAAQGIDLRGNPLWADGLLSELVAAWTGRDDDGDGGGGRAGGVADPEDHAEAGPTRVARNGGKAASA